MGAARVQEKIDGMDPHVVEEIEIRRVISDNHRDEFQIPDVSDRVRKRIDRFMEVRFRFKSHRRRFEIMRHVSEVDAKRICAVLQGPRMWQTLWLCRRWRLKTKETGNTYIFSPRKVHIVIDFW